MKNYEINLGLCLRPQDIGDARSMRHDQDICRAKLEGCNHLSLLAESMELQDLKFVLLCSELTLAQYFLSGLLVGLIAFCIMLWLWPYGVQTEESIDVNGNGSYRLTCLNMWSRVGRPVQEGLSGLALLKKVCNSQWVLRILKSHSISTVFL